MLQWKHLKNLFDQLNAGKTTGETYLFMIYVNIYLASQKLMKPNVNSNKFNFYYQNAHGINTKLDILSRNVALADNELFMR